MKNLNQQKKAGHSPRICAILFMVKQAPRDHNKNSMVEILDSNSLGFFYHFKN
tara:strand:- start:3345 stop:3503 length:159 start_codon:yes stop_codon:yes gene_type:complete